MQARRAAEFFVLAILFAAMTISGLAQNEQIPRSAPAAPPAASSAFDPSSLQIAPGISLPPYGAVWILDRTESKPRLVRVPVTSAVANKHGGGNLARDQVLVIKDVASLDLLGAASGLRVASRTPAIFIRQTDPAEGAMQSPANPNDLLSHYVLVRMRAQKNRRELCSFSYWKFGGRRTRHEDDVEVSSEEIAGGRWLKLTPKQPLPDGEYAVVRMPDDKTQAGTEAYDFGVGPTPGP
jgi:hypothetical protein